ncbi:hypothetical protein J3R83DRAFT_5905 [Lanmaoa asiatica]|nr:hypothetical protein J3R83DRAFT_5905 [Lanmaoa asiatica]
MMPTTQKAWMAVKQGKPRDALAFGTDVPVPKPKPGEVLVRVRTAALNPVGWKSMGALPNVLSKRPHPAEHDLAGVIVDANGTSFSNGDEVIWVHSHAAALPLALSTAVQALRPGGGYDPAHALGNTSASTPANQESIFINGGSTAVDIYAIQIAKALSLRVTASASGRNESFVRGVGADTFLDYTVQPIAEQLSANPPDPRFCMVLDAGGSSDTAMHVKWGTYVKKGGAYVTL